MTWSINWDNGKSKAGVAYNWEFKTRYAPLIQGGVTPPPGKPNAPTALTVAELGATSLKLSWAAATGPYRSPATPSTATATRSARPPACRWPTAA